LHYTETHIQGSLIDLDGDLRDKLSGVTCDIDHTRLALHFKHRADAIQWVLRLHDLKDHFIVGGAQWNCSARDHGTYILRRVMASSESSHLGKQVSITTTMARYDEVFSSADISYGTLGECNEQLGTSKHICLGYNTNCDGAAKQPIPLYSNAKISFTCEDCWAALEADVFVNVSIRDWKLQRLAGGFQNSRLNSSLVFNGQADASWSLALDKTLSLIKTDYLLNFKIGSVPFMLFFDVPMKVQSDITFESAASLTAGVGAAIELGDAFISWDPINHWTHSMPTFKPKYFPTLSSSASAALHGTFAIVPSFNLHFDQIFDYSINADPTITADVASNTQPAPNICISSSYSMSVTAQAELHMNIPILNFHKDWQYGPKQVATWTGEPVPKICKNITHSQ
jgi:hypothetical protein